MNLSLQTLLNDYQNFDAYLTQFGEDPNKFPGPMNKFIKLSKIASEKNMLSFNENKMVNSKNFEENARSSNSFQEMIQRYAADMAASIESHDRKSEAYNNIISAPIASVVAVPAVMAVPLTSSLLETESHYKTLFVDLLDHSISYDNILKNDLNNIVELADTLSRSIQRSIGMFTFNNDSTVDFDCLKYWLTNLTTKIDTHHADLIDRQVIIQNS